MVMRGNRNVLQSLQSFYRNLQCNDQFPLKTSCESDIFSFAAQVGSFVYDLEIYIDRGKLLAENIAARKTMVHFFQHVYTCNEAKYLPYIDLTAPSKPNHGEDGKADDQHAKGLLDGKSHSIFHVYLPSSYICFGRPPISNRRYSN